ncbi:MAG TPA: phage tail sheath C-terminal domain-containing protein, partial [Pyrinomonadaceae bacterium]|nr:phage tail sheath C-terminal domain-containing protein [Pyrinomonadaceae bacterium]
AGGGGGAAAPRFTTPTGANTGADGDPLTYDATTTPAHTADENTAATNAAFFGDQNLKTGIYQLLKTDIFNMLVFPPLAVAEGDPSLVSAEVLGRALTLCADRRAMLIVDAPATWDTVSLAVSNAATFLNEESAKNAALYFPYLRVTDPDRDQGGRKINMPPGGAVAGVYARTDTQRGVWKAPAGTDATLNGVPELSLPMTDLENGRLNPLAVNCLRSFQIIGRVVWGARTMRGADALGDDWKYVPVRRLALFIEESLYRGTKWVVFEPNDEPLWAQIRLNVGAFMQNLFRQGAFQGSSPREAYFVKCDRDTTTQNHINLGIVNIHVGFAPLKPAEFVIIRIQQMAGQVEV